MKKQHLNPATVFQPSHYSQLVRVQEGELIVLAGQVAFDAEGQIVAPNDLRLQEIQSFENIKSLLAAVGADFSHVVKLTVYVVDYQLSDRAVLLEVLERYIDLEAPPANTLLGVQALARPGLKIEIEALAVI